ncbi:MAG: DUF3857 domain-containing protein [bacterium]|nr:DUF3857 domain-containing protein [bacterium]
MRTLLRMLALLVCASFAFAEFNGLPDYVQTKLSALQKYPRASSILLWARESHALDADGSQIYEWHSFRWIPDEAARDNYGDPHVAYVEGRQTLDILTARTYTRDGRRIDSTPHNAFNAIVPEGLDKALDYADFRQMVITLLGLENGCVSELHYRLTTAKPLWPWIEGRVYFREEYPVISRELVVTVPPGAVLNYRCDRGAPDPAISNGTYTWKMTEQPGYLAEDLQDHRLLLPNVVFSSAADWPQVTNELRSRLETALAGDISVPSSLRDGLLKATSDEARLDTIKTWVRDRFNRLEFEHPDFGLTLRPMPQVLESGYGNSLELAALVSKLAGTTGVNAQVAAWFLPDAPVPSLHAFHGALLSVKLDGLRFYCDPLEPRAEFTQAQLLGTTILDLDPDAVQPEEFRCRARSPYVNLTIALDDLTADTLRGHGTFSSSGEWGIYEKMRPTDPAKYVAEIVHVAGLTIDEATVKTLEPARISANAVVEFTFHASALDTADGRRILPLTLLDFKAYAGGAPLNLTEREFAQWIPLPGEITLHVEAPLPAGWRMERQPASASPTWDWSQGVTRCEIRESRLIFERTLKLAREWIAPSGWKGFRAWMLDADTRPVNVVVFTAN